MELNTGPEGASLQGAVGARLETGVLGLSLKGGTSYVQLSRGRKEHLCREGCPSCPSTQAVLGVWRENVVLS